MSVHRRLKTRLSGLALCLGCCGSMGLAWATPVTVEISGLEDALAQNVRARLTIATEENDAEPARLRDAHSLAPDEIREALEPFGYYHAVVTASLEQRDGDWTAVYRIEPGEPVRLRSLDIRLLGEAAATPEARLWREHYPLQTGDRLDQVAYEKSKTRWQTLMTEQGYFDAHMPRHTLDIDAGQSTADLTLHLDSGVRYRYAALHFDETPLNESLLRRFGSLTQGAEYQSSSLLLLQKNLLNSGYFRGVDIEPQLDQRANGAVPIAVHLSMNAQNRYQLGGGYGMDTGPRLTLGYRNRYINRYGHHFQSTLRLSMIRSELDALYAIPLEDPVREQLGFTAQLRAENTEAGQSKLGILGVRRSVARWGLREVMSLDLHRETWDIDGSRTAFLVLPGVSYTWVDTDNTLDVREGMRLSLAASGTSRSLVSDAGFLKLSFTAKGIHSFMENNRLIGRAQLGYILSEDYRDIPLSLRFYAGGNSSIRGYRLNEVGPLNALGQHQGGRYLTVGSLEYERTLFGPWGLAFFYDAGSAFNRPGFTPAQGAGMGVRWRSPFGPVRLDVGMPLVGGIDPFQVSFMLGPEL